MKLTVFFKNVSQIGMAVQEFIDHINKKPEITVDRLCVFNCNFFINRPYRRTNDMIFNPLGFSSILMPKKSKKEKWSL